MNIASLPDEIISQFDVLGLEPLTRFQFSVQIDGDIFGSQFVAGFDKVIGVGDKVEVMEILEGGYPGRHRFPAQALTNQIKLVRGMSFNRGFWRWFDEVRNWTKGRPNYRKTLSIYMLDSIYQFGQHVPYEVWRFDIFNAWPSEWTGPEFSARDIEQAFESITIQHGGISEAKSMLSDTIAPVASLLQEPTQSSILR